jgi:hypothetical protein
MSSPRGINTYFSLSPFKRRGHAAVSFFYIYKRKFIFFCPSTIKYLATHIVYYSIWLSSCGSSGKISGKGRQMQLLLCKYLHANIGKLCK